MYLKFAKCSGHTHTHTKHMVTVWGNGCVNYLDYGNQVIISQCILLLNHYGVYLKKKKKLKHPVVGGLSFLFLLKSIIVIYIFLWYWHSSKLWNVLENIVKINFISLLKCIYTDTLLFSFLISLPSQYFDKFYFKVVYFMTIFKESASNFLIISNFLFLLIHAFIHIISFLLHSFGSYYFSSFLNWINSFIFNSSF